MRKSKLNLIALLINIAIVGIFVFIGEKSDNELNEKLYKEYNSLTKKDSINAIVLSKYFPEQWRGAAYTQYIKLNNGYNLFIHVDRQINTQHKTSFGSVVARGVRLIKNSYSDTLIVDTKKERYYYILNFYDASKDTANFIEKIFR